VEYNTKIAKGREVSRCERKLKMEIPNLLLKGCRYCSGDLVLQGELLGMSPEEIQSLIKEQVIY